MSRVGSVVVTVVCGIVAVAVLSFRSRAQQAGDGGAAPPAALRPQPVVIAGTVPPPQTRIEAVAARKGGVLVTSYSEPVVLNGDDGSLLRLSAIEVRDAKASVSAAGLMLALRGPGNDNGGGETTAYVDRDEIDGVIDALDTLGKLDSTVAGSPNFEGRYRTRGDVEVANVEANGSRMLAIRGTQTIAPTGQFSTANALFRMSRLDELNRMLSEARDALGREPADTGGR